MHNDLIVFQDIEINNTSPELVEKYVYLVQFTHKSSSLQSEIKQQI